MRRLGISIGAFLVPPFSLALLVWLSLVLNFSLVDLVIGNWSVLGFDWQSLGTPVQTIGASPASGTQDQYIVSATGGFYDLYISTADGRIFSITPDRTTSPVWEAVKVAPHFDQPPQVYIACGLAVADGNKLYTFERSWNLLQHPVIGPIRDIVNAEGGIFLEGDTQIYYSGDCGKTWQEFWNGPALESNLAVSYSDLLVASDGKLMARGFKKDSFTPEVIWSDWRDVSGILAGKHIRFLALGAKNWAIAATANEVYRSPGPLGNWETFGKGLPGQFQVERLMGSTRRAGKIGLTTRQGLFTYSDGAQWDQVWGFGKPVLYLDFVQTYAEGMMERTYIIGPNNVWTHREGHDLYGVVFGAMLLLGVLVILFAISMIVGVILGTRTWRRLKPTP